MRLIMRLLVIPGFLVVVSALAGCNTIHGFGKDLSAGGNAIANAATKVKDGKTGDQAKVKTTPVKKPKTTKAPDDSDRT